MEDYYESDDDSDDEGTQTIIIRLPGDYELHLKKSWPEGSNITYIYSSLKNLANNVKIGSMTAYLFARGSWGNMQFYSDCDAVTQETNDIAQIFTKQDGRLSYDVIEGLDKDEDRQRSSRGGFLVVEEVRIVKKERGKDLSLDMVEALLDHLGSEWTIAWMAPFSLTIDTSNQSKEEIQAGNIALARHFARLGFVQACTQVRRQACKFWYLIPERRARKAKEEVQQLPVILMSWFDDPADNENNKLITAVLEAENGHIDHLETITQCLSGGEDINQSEALFFAIANDKWDVVQHLLKLGADVGHKNKYGATPLHAAADFLNMKIVQLLLSHGADKEAINDDGKTPFELAVAEIKNKNKFVATFNLNWIRVRQFEERCHKLIILHLLANNSFNLIEGVLTPRMFYRLKVVADLAADNCKDLMPEFNRGVPISKDDALCFIHLLSEVPENEIPDEVFKSYAFGWQQQLEAIASVMGKGLLPTESRVQYELRTNGSDWRYSSYFSKNGGSLLHALLALVEAARKGSEEAGDGSFEETFGNDLNVITANKLLDEDFLFTKYFFVSYCVTPGAAVVVPDVVVLPSARQPPTSPSDRSSPSGVKRPAKGFSSTKRKAQKTLR